MRCDKINGDDGGRTKGVGRADEARSVCWRCVSIDGDGDGDEEGTYVKPLGVEKKEA